jgi:hypothetical protein
MSTQEHWFPSRLAEPRTAECLELLASHQADRSLGQGSTHLPRPDHSARHHQPPTAARLNEEVTP